MSSDGRGALAPPRDPEFKGMVERNNGFFETSFLPGRAFASPVDFNAQLAEWLTTAPTPAPSEPSGPGSRLTGPSGERIRRPARRAVIRAAR